MSSLIRQDAENGGSIMYPLEGRDRFHLVFDGVTGEPVLGSEGEANVAFTIARAGTAGSPAESCFILVKSSSANGKRVLVNGDEVPAGIRSLRDRDEILVLDTAGKRSDRIYFSVDSPSPEIVPFPGPKGARCAMCTGIIDINAPSVRCPRCGLWYHQITEGKDPLPCWTYEKNCMSCKRPTELKAQEV